MKILTDADVPKIAAALVDTIKVRAKEEWDANETARKFIQERATRLAKLTVKIAKAKVSETGEEEASARDFKFVQQSMENELAVIALRGSAAAQETFKEVAKTAFGFLTKLAIGLL